MSLDYQHIQRLCILRWSDIEPSVSHAELGPLKCMEHTTETDQLQSDLPGKNVGTKLVVDVYVIVTL